MAALDIQRVETGALITHQEPIYEIIGYARIYAQLSNNNHDPQPWMDIINSIENMTKESIPKEVRTLEGDLRDYNLRPLQVHRLEGLSLRIAHHHARPKRGLFDFIGNIASDLFGIPSADDIRLLQEANTRLASAVDGLVHTQQALVGRVNILGRNQARMMSAINEISRRQEYQASLMEQFAGYTHRYMRIMILTDILSDALDQLAAQDQQALLAHTACESRKANELLLPTDLVRSILSPGENHQPISVMNYYGYIEIEKITSFSLHISHHFILYLTF